MTYVYGSVESGNKTPTLSALCSQILLNWLTTVKSKGKITKITHKYNWPAIYIYISMKLPWHCSTELIALIYELG